MDREYIFVLTVCDTETMGNERVLSLSGKDKKDRFKEISENKNITILDADVWPAKFAERFENPGMEKFK